MKKVYCKNCKYLKWWEFHIAPYCKMSVTMEYYYGKRDDCPLYKRKWWKFWVK
jgi:hypothetical protein